MLVCNFAFTLVLLHCTAMVDQNTPEPTACANSVTNLEYDCFHNCQFTPGVQIDDLARSAKRGLLAPVVPEFSARQNKPPLLARAQAHVQLGQVATVFDSLEEGGSDRGRERG